MQICRVLLTALYCKNCDDGENETIKSRYLVKSGTRLAVFVVEEEEGQYKGDVLVKGVQDTSAQIAVVVAPVHQQQVLEETELGNGVVRSIDGLDSFLSADPNTNMRGLAVGVYKRRDYKRRDYKRRG